jgi:hypothetical protein
MAALGELLARIPPVSRYWMLAILTVAGAVVSSFHGFASEQEC